MLIKINTEEVSLSDLKITRVINSASSLCAASHIVAPQEGGIMCLIKERSICLLVMDMQVTVMELRQRGNFSKPLVSVSDAQTSCRY